MNEDSVPADKSKALGTGMAQVVERNIKALLNRRKEESKKKPGKIK